MQGCFSCVWLCETLWTVSYQTPLSVGFLRQEYFGNLGVEYLTLSGPPPGNLPDPWIKPTSLMSPVLGGSFFTTSATWEAHSNPINKPESKDKINRNTISEAFWNLLFCASVWNKHNYFWKSNIIKCWLCLTCNLPVEISIPVTRKSSYSRELEWTRRNGCDLKRAHLPHSGLIPRRGFLGLKITDSHHHKCKFAK